MEMSLMSKAWPLKDVYDINLKSQLTGLQFACLVFVLNFVKVASTVESSVKNFIGNNKKSDQNGI